MINSKRLTLRQWTEDDKESFFQINSNPNVMRFFPKALSREESDSLVDKMKALIEENGWGLFATELKESKELIGMIGLHYQTFDADFTPCVEIGWRLSEKFWKQGYATEGALAVLKYAFEELKLDEVASFTSKLNLPSIAVMEKIGMTRDYDGDFEHPQVKKGQPLRPHVLYRLKNDLK